MNITRPTAWVRLALGLSAFLPAYAAANDKGRGESETVAEGVRTIGGDKNNEPDSGTDVRVDVIVDMTDAGKKVLHPTPDQPSYFLPLFFGYKQEGGYLPFYQKPPPADADVENLILKALAAQDYRVMTKEHHPSLVLTFYWGYLAPMQGPGSMIPDGLPIPLNAQINQRETLGMVAGMTANNGIDMLDPRTAEIADAVEVGRNYILASAFDFNDWLHKRTTLLWRAHVSTSYWGHYLDQVLPTLIATGAPMFGRETKIPQMINVPVTPMGHVILGTPEVKDYATKPAEPGR